MIKEYIMGKGNMREVGTDAGNAYQGDDGGDGDGDGDGGGEFVPFTIPGPGQ